MPSSRAARRPIPSELPGWVVWLLGLNLPETNKRLVWITILGSAITVAAAAYTAPGRPLSVAGAWAITMVTVALVCAAMGLQRLYRVGGILISERNVMSLTRFQITAWTIMIGSALLTIGMSRAFHPEVNGVTEALDIVVPDEVWQLLGIASGSTVLSTMIKRNKESVEPANSPDVAARTATMIQGEDAQAVEDNRRGILYGNSDPRDARFMDMLEGDELANAAFLDVGKVQMFFFTVMSLLMYGTVLWVMMQGDAGMITQMPALTPAMIKIVGISHVAYLGTKFVPQTPTDANAKPKPAPPAENPEE
ncbi:MAG TPA: hypothetical protein VNA69_14410 [Thermoanaerobaculia bacterium]|nr:hypothetical protein [Thermoanaerobaculia bacterium]